jgi:S1-C subfamily serine protease
MKYRLMSYVMCGLVLTALTGAAGAEDTRETPLVRAVKRAAPSVVNIHTEKTTVERDTVFTPATASPAK